MHDIIKYFVIIFLSTFAWADNYWLKKKANFEQHSKEFYQRRTNILKAKPKYIQNKQKSDIEKSHLKWTFLENQLQKDNRNEAQKLFNLFINPKNNRKKDAKRKFIEIRNKNKKLEEKYKIPLEDQLFL